MGKFDNSRALFICVSPLQAALTINLIKIKKVCADVIYLSSKYDLRTKYYIEALRESCSNVYFINVNKRKAWSVLLSIELILFRAKKISEVYIASYNYFYVAYIVNRLNIDLINIFDDGVFSLVDKNNRISYYPPLPTGLAAKIILKLFQINKINEDLLVAARYFYTIFPLHQQLVEDDKIVAVEFSLIGGDRFISPLVKNLNIFIGDVYEELSEIQKLLYEKTINNKSIDYYIPHPRESNLKIGNNKVLSIHTIAEEFILSLLEAGYTLNILSFASSVLFTLPSHGRLNKYIIKQPKYLLHFLSELAQEYNILFIKENEISSRLTNIASY